MHVTWCAMIVVALSLIARVNGQQCQPGYIRNAEGTCQLCTTNCIECKTGETCETCKPGNFLSSGVCISCAHVQKCKECESWTVCRVCHPGYFLKAGACVPCIDTNCKSCTGPGETCSVCKPGYFLTSETCSRCMDNHCRECSGIGTTCSVCEPSYYVDPAGQCQDCDASCFRCINATNCSICKTGFRYVDGRCVACPSNCNLCEGTSCKLCYNRFYLENGLCKDCRNTCSKCLSYDVCDECTDGRYGDTCQFECDRTKCAACINTPTNCTECTAGRYGHNCQFQCDRTKCAACIITPTHCTKCNPGYKVVNSVCCHDNCVTCDGQGQCTSCPDGFYGTTCSDKCNDSCKTCTDGDKCKKCVASKFDSKSTLESGMCLCDKNQCNKIINPQICIECKQAGWYVSESGCCPCSNNCKPSEECASLTGACRDGCRPGWWGSHCDKKCRIEHCVECNVDICVRCDVEYHGIRCQHRCSPNCSRVADQNVCDMIFGDCLHGCNDGNWGVTCERTCGGGCVNRQCNSSFGHCLACDTTHKGPLCQDLRSIEDQDSQIIRIIIGVSVFLIIIVVIVITIVIIRRRSARRKESTSMDEPGNYELEEPDDVRAISTQMKKSI